MISNGDEYIIKFAPLGKDPIATEAEKYSIFHKSK